MANSRRIRRWMVFVPLLAGAVACAVIANPFLPIIQFQLAGSSMKAQEILNTHSANDFRIALLADTFIFVPAYVLTFALAAWRHLPNRLLAVLTLGFAVFAGYCDVIENIYLRQGLKGMADADFQAAQLFAMVKFMVFIPAIVLGLMALRTRDHHPIRD